MELLTLLIVALLACVGFFVLLWKSDCDLFLLWNSKFGAKAESLAGKVIWITGASSGIGECLAYELAKHGCRLVLSARRDEELERVKTECIKRSGAKIENIMVLKLDMLNLDYHPTAVKHILECFGKIDILVNNAGRSLNAAAIDTPMEVEKQVAEINTFSVLSLTKAVLPHMVQRREGHIVVTSSLAGKIGAPYLAGYSLSKFALQGWFDAMRTEQSENNVRVTMVCPGPVHSNITKEAFTKVVGKKIGAELHASKKLMKTERCAELMAVAIANKMYEVWIAENPFLLWVYLAQYSPTFARWLPELIGLDRVKKARHYDE